MPNLAVRMTLSLTSCGFLGTKPFYSSSAVYFVRAVKLVYVQIRNQRFPRMAEMSSNWNVVTLLISLVELGD